jgi:hypothetical protein
MENLLAEEPRSGMPDDDGALIIATDHVGTGLGGRARASARFWVVVVVVLVERRIGPFIQLCRQDV